MPITSKNNALVFSEEITIQNLENLTRELDKLLNNSAQKIILNFEDVKNIDCAVLNVLLAFKKTTELRKKVILCKMNPKVSKIFTISGVGKHFK